MNECNEAGFNRSIGVFVVGSACGQSPAKIRVTIVNPSPVAPNVGYFGALCPEQDGEDFH